jgi:hypothetical protein
MWLLPCDHYVKKTSGVIAIIFWSCDSFKAALGFGAQIASVLGRNKRRTMKRLCAWCGKALENSNCNDDSRASHWICPTCRRTVFGNEKTKDGEVRPHDKNAVVNPANAEESTSPAVKSALG